MMYFKALNFNLAQFIDLYISVVCFFFLCNEILRPRDHEHSLLYSLLELLLCFTLKLKLRSALHVG